MLYNERMTFIQNVTEYYDELYPVTEEQKKFYSRIQESYPTPARFLQIGCGTGALEHVLIKSSADITGIEVSKELIEIAAPSTKSPSSMSTLKQVKLWRFP